MTDDGVERKFDLVVLSAGFQVSKFLWPMRLVGRQGVTPDDLWVKDGARAYLGVMLPGLPNFFVAYGPNSQSRAGGIFSWAEIWSRYIAGALVKTIEGGHRSVEVKRAAYDCYNARLDERMSQLTRGAEAGGYYVNEHGRVVVNIPWFSYEFHAMLFEPDAADLDFA